MASIDRKLATVRRIAEIKPIEGADLIVAYRVDGWWVVDSKGKYNVGDLVVYLEIDSWVPTNIAPFLSKGKDPSEYKGVQGERLKSIRLKGQISQGLLLQMENHLDGGWLMPVTRRCHVEEGEDVTKELNIQKWEPPVPAQLAGEIEGMFPTHLVPKTDQERIQNIFEKIKHYINNNRTLDDEPKPIETRFTLEEKLDGSSCTIILHDGQIRVCSRNLELRRSENNSFWKAVAQYEATLLEFHNRTKRNFALQGELIGEGIQGNPYKLKGQQLYVFDMYDIDNQFYMVSDVRRKFVDQFGMNNIPYRGTAMYSSADNFTFDTILVTADGESELAPGVLREGLVWKCETDGSISFKVISDRWLIKTGK